MKQKKVFANEMKPIMDYIFNQINSTKIKNDEITITSKILK